MNLEQFPAQFVNNRQMAGVPEGAVLAGERACGAGSECRIEERATRTTPVIIGACGEPDRIMLVGNESRWDSA
jgi:hypothetical protein